MKHPSPKSKVRSHTHGSYLAKQILVEERVKLDRVIRETPNITPNSATTGINPLTGEIIAPVQNINVILDNKGRTKHEIRASKIRQKLVSLKGIPIAEFEKLEGQYPNYIQDAQMASSKIFISFFSPEVKEFPLPFENTL